MINVLNNRKLTDEQSVRLHDIVSEHLNPKQNNNPKLNSINQELGIIPNNIKLIKIKEKALKKAQNETQRINVNSGQTV